MADATVRGQWVWHELLTTDLKAAAGFFKKVHGWTAAPYPGGNGYELFSRGKTVTGGLMALPDEAKQMGAPPHWESYIGTPNVDDTVRAAVSLGANVLKAATDLPSGGGRFAVLMDPQGASFGVYTPPPGPPPPPPAIGDYSWHELATTDPQGAIAFYTKLFGWTEAGAQDMGEGVGMYYMFGAGGAPTIGLFKKPSGMPGSSFWLPYLLVADVKKSAAAITKAGGTVINGPMEVPGGDWIAQAVDAQGVMFAVHARAAAAPTPAKSPAVKKSAVKKSAAKKSAAKKSAVRKAAKAGKAPKKAKRAKPAARRAGGTRASKHAKKVAPKKKGRAGQKK